MENFYSLKEEARIVIKRGEGEYKVEALRNFWSEMKRCRV
jgi:hypothetical protein